MAKIKFSEYKRIKFRRHILVPDNNMECEIPESFTQPMIDKLEGRFKIVSTDQGGGGSKADLTDEEFNWSAASKDVTLDYYPVEFPSLINTKSVPVGYSSQSGSVASIDSNGKVTIVGNGSTNINATFSGDEEYNPKQVSYQLNIQLPKKYSHFGIKSESVGTITIYTPSFGDSDEIKYIVINDGDNEPSDFSNGTVLTRQEVPGTTESEYQLTIDGSLINKVILFEGNLSDLAYIDEDTSAFASTKINFQGTNSTILGDLTSLAKGNEGTWYSDESFTYFEGDLVDASRLDLSSWTSVRVADMFKDCTRLSISPVMYTIGNNTFNGCQNLRSIKLGFTEWPVLQDYSGWMSGVSAQGTIIAPTNLDIHHNQQGVPQAWIIVKY